MTELNILSADWTQVHVEKHLEREAVDKWPLMKKMEVQKLWFEVRFHGMSKGWPLRILYAAIAHSSDNGVLHASTIISWQNLLKALWAKAEVWHGFREKWAVVMLLIVVTSFMSAIF